MRTGVFTAALVSPATAGLAHEGGHLHPHGSEGWLMLLVALALIAAALVVARWGR
jgi:hypothetical protein